MFCPKCKAEYNDEVRQCADCGAPLVRELPKEHKRADLEFVCIIQTFNPGDIAMIESVLEGSGIDYFLQGVNAVSVVPYIEPARVLVVKEQADEARALLKDLDLTINLHLPHARFDDDDGDRQSSEVENGEDET